MSLAQSLFIYLFIYSHGKKNHQLSYKKKKLKKKHNTVLHDCRAGIRYVSDSIYDFSFEVPNGANIPHLLGQIVP